jgi:hypothetical protein
MSLVVDTRGSIGRFLQASNNILGKREYLESCLIPTAATSIADSAGMGIL